MYARNYQENETVQPFRKGEYNVPANYHGSVFSVDESPCKDTHEDSNKGCPISAPEPELHRCEDCKRDKSVVPCPLESDHGETSNETPCESERKKGIFSGILSRFDKGFELDDLLIIGLVLILLNGDKAKCPENRDEIIILLALLLLGG